MKLYTLISRRNKHILNIFSEEERPPEKGQSLVEFAVMLVILLVMLAGISDLGRALFTYMALRDAAQEGALYASINPTQITGIQNRVYNSSQTVHDLVASAGGVGVLAAPLPVDHGSTSPLVVQVTYLSQPCAGHGVQVRVTYTQFPITMPFLGGIIGAQTVPISAAVTDTILLPLCGS